MRFLVFIVIALSVWAGMHAYVFMRLASVPWIAALVSGRTLGWTALALWAGYPAARILAARRIDAVAIPLELMATVWIGLLFLLFAGMLAVDTVTIGGWLWPRLAPTLRGGAAVAAGALAAIALVQGLRPPVVSEHEVELPGLPAAQDGLVLVAVSDLHLGTLLGRGWLERLTRRIDGLQPDVIAIVGDLIDGDAGRVEAMLPQLRHLKAPHGVWAVIGNHDFYAGVGASERVLAAAGYRVLRNRWVEVVPGLVLAGVDDLSLRQHPGPAGEIVDKALAGRPAGSATVLLSHAPLEAPAAARDGVGLMLSGHTHAGQLWPFDLLVRTSYRFVGGRYEVDGMPLIVGRGTGTWGPRMRLWRPAEILRIRLRSG